MAGSADSGAPEPASRARALEGAEPLDRGTPRNRSRNVTLREVAQRAGVSIATASKALNGRDQVHPETRQRVKDAAARLSFTPNSVARGLLAGRTGTVGLLANDLVGRFSIPILMGVEDAFGADRMSVLLCDSRDDSIRERYHLQALLGRRVDGLIVVGSDTNPRPSLGSNLPLPVVYAYGPSDDPRDVSIVPDNVAAGASATRHLLGLGRRRIAHITGPAEFAASVDRAAGMTEELRKAGTGLVGGGVMFGTWTEEWGRAAASALLEQRAEVDAILCGSDQIARGALDVLRERGIDVPATIAVAGFDNWDLFTSGARPQLTSFDPQLESLGRLAAARLLEAMDGDGPVGARQGVESLPGRLVVRGSTMTDR